MLLFKDAIICIKRYKISHKIMLNILKINNFAINKDKLFILHRSHFMAVLLIKN